MTRRTFPDRSGTLRLVAARLRQGYPLAAASARFRVELGHAVTIRAFPGGCGGQNFIWARGGMADTVDSKSIGRKAVRVQVPPRPLVRSVRLTSNHLCI